MMKRVFLVVLDSFGVGGAADAGAFGDKGSDTFGAVRKSVLFSVPNMRRAGLYKIVGEDEKIKALGGFGKLSELSAGKDTTVGHWELAGLISKRPMPVYPDGFPKEMIEKYERLTGRKVLCNKPCSGVDAIKDYAAEQKKSGGLIVYTSADSVFQVAAHEEWIGLDELYRCCRIARGMEELGVGRVIARPFIGEAPDFVRTGNRHDYSLEPFGETMPDIISEAGLDVIGVGKISDIFAGRGITESFKTMDNRDGEEKLLSIRERDFHGLCFVNLVDFDSKYGHRNDVNGYAAALSEFDSILGEFINGMREDDMLIVTADHGCDPSTESTDHSRENVPVMVVGKKIRPDVKISGYMSDVSATVLEALGLGKKTTAGKSFYGELI